MVNSRTSAVTHFGCISSWLVSFISTPNNIQPIADKTQNIKGQNQTEKWILLLAAVQISLLPAQA